MWLMGLGRIRDNSTLIGLGEDCPSKEVKYFINTISFILLNFLWCGIYYTQLPGGQLTTEKCMVVPKAQECLCSQKEKGVGVGVGEELIDGVTHSSAHSLNRKCWDSIMCQALTSRLKEEMRINKICPLVLSWRTQQRTQSRRWKALTWNIANCCDT